MHFISYIVRLPRAARFLRYRHRLANKIVADLQHVKHGFALDGIDWRIGGSIAPATARRRPQAPRRSPYLLVPRMTTQGLSRTTQSRSGDSDAVIDRIRAGFAKRHGAALPVAIEKVRYMEDLPPALQAAARRQHFNLRKGVFFESVV
jgi:hypothetical protein